jgi:hypothetical protein
MRRVAAILREVTGPRVAAAMVLLALHLRAVGVLLVRLPLVHRLAVVVHLRVVGVLLVRPHQVGEVLRPEGTVRLVHHLEGTVRLAHHLEGTVRLAHHLEGTVRLAHHLEGTVRLVHHLEGTVRLVHHLEGTVRLGAATVHPVVLRRLVVASHRLRTSQVRRHPVVEGPGSKGVRRSPSVGQR